MTAGKSSRAPTLRLKEGSRVKVEGLKAKALADIGTKVTALDTFLMYACVPAIPLYSRVIYSHAEGVLLRRKSQPLP